MINTVKHLAYILSVKQSALTEIINNIDSYYYEKKELKRNKDGTPKLKNGLQQTRIIHPSKSQLKLIQTRILKRIFYKIGFPEYAYGGVPGRNNIKNAKAHQGKKYIFSTDLKNYFPTITNRRVFSTYLSLGFSPTVSSLLTKLTTYKGHIPQGAPTSTSLANFCFLSTGNRLYSFSKENHITFTSYVDDLTFSSSNNFKHIVPSIIEIIERDDFFINRKKTKYQTSRPVVTGIPVHNNCLGISDFIKTKHNLSTSEKTRAGIEKYILRILKTNTPKSKDISQTE